MEKKQSRRKYQSPTMLVVKVDYAQQLCAASPNGGFENPEPETW